MRARVAKPTTAEVRDAKLAAEFSALPIEVRERALAYARLPPRVRKAADLFSARLNVEKLETVVEAVQFLEIYPEVVPYMMTGEWYKKLIHGTRGILQRLDGAADYGINVLTGGHALEEESPEEKLSRLDKILDDISKSSSRLIGVFHSLDVVLFGGGEPAEVGSQKVAEMLKAAIDFSVYATPEPGRHRILTRGSEEEIPAVFGKEARLTMVFLNVINNARQAIGPFNDGEINVELGSTMREGKKFLRVTVRDTGAGLDESDKKIGTLGYTTKRDGTGFGVAGSRMILREVGGTLALRNRTDGTRGAEAEILIPAK